MFGYKLAHSKFCAMKGCGRSRANSPGISFFRFPKDPERCKIWIANAGRDDLKEVPLKKLYTNYQVCADHFASNHFMNERRNSLTHSAVPRISISNACSATNTMSTSAVGDEEKTDSFISTDHQYFSVTCDGNESSSTPKVQSVSSSNNNICKASNKRKYLDEDLTPGKRNNRCKHVDEDLTPRKRKMKRIIRRKTTQILQLKRSIKSLKLSSKTLKQKSKAIEGIVKQAENILPTECMQFFKIQLEASLKCKYAHRWTPEARQIAMNLYFVSPAAYRTLAKVCMLPSVRTIQRWTNHLGIRPGFSAAIFNLLKIKVETMKQKEKLCSILMDEMAIKHWLTYIEHIDFIEGFDDCGPNIKHTGNIANQCLIFMVRGLTSNWKQPLGYFLSCGAMSASILKQLVAECIKKVVDIGLHPLALVCDQGPNNRSLYNSLGITINEPYFEISNHKIFAIYDAPHLLKSTRNNLMNYNMKVGDHIIKWEYVVDFCKKDLLCSIRQAPRVTKDHIYVPPFKKMSVPLAAQILSYSVAAGIYSHSQFGSLPAEAVFTAEFIEKIDHIFDTCNSRKKYDEAKSNRDAMSDENDIEQFLKDSLKWVSSWQYIGAKGVIPSHTGWQITLSAILQLWNCLKKLNVEYFITSRVNQDPLENLFSIIRQKGGNMKNPSATHLRHIFKQVCTKFLTKPPKGANCLPDAEKFLLELSNVQDELSLESTWDVCGNSSILVNKFSETIEERNALTYFSGYLAKDLRKKHSCEECLKYIEKKDAVLSNANELFTYWKNYCSNISDFGALRIPTTTFLTFVESCEKLFCEYFPIYAASCSIKEKIIEKIISNTDTSWFQTSTPSCIKTIYSIVSTFVKVRIYHCLKTYNKNFAKAKNSAKSSQKLKNLQHV